MSELPPTANHGAAIGLDHIGIVGNDLDVLAAAFQAAGFHLTPRAAHASGRTANRCAMFRDGGYLELIAAVPGQRSATLEGFLTRGMGAHILALETEDEIAALTRLHRAGIEAGEALITTRDSGLDGRLAKFALIMPPDPPVGGVPEGRVLLIRHLTRDLLWRPGALVHPNGAVALIEAIHTSAAPAETMARLSRLSGRPAEPDPLGGYFLPLGRGRVRILPPAAAAALFPDAAWAPSLMGLTIAAESGGDRTVHAGGVAIRFIATRP